jgi:hypothetical protein
LRVFSIVLFVSYFIALFTAIGYGTFTLDPDAPNGKEVYNWLALAELCSGAIGGGWLAYRTVKWSVPGVQK